MMKSKKKRGRPKNTISEFACGKVSGRANPRNPEVFVLPPEILRQLGIHLNKHPESSSQNAGSAHNHACPGQVTPTQHSRKNQTYLQEIKIQKPNVANVDISDNTEYKIPKSIDAKIQSNVVPKKSASPIARPSTSIMETANLMKASLFLSPTFSQVNVNNPSVVENKHISDNLNDSATTTSIVDDLPGDVNISSLSIGGLNEVLNSTVDVVSEETHFKDSIDNGRNYSMECGGELVDSVSETTVIDNEENVNIENHCEIIEGNRVCSENIEFLKEIQEMSDENILLEIYDMSKANLSDTNIADCTILESPYELDNPQISVTSAQNAKNEYNHDGSKHVASANLLETSQDTSESKYDTEGSRDSNITVGREDYILKNVPYVTSTPMINASHIDMGIESGSMENSNNFLDACLSSESNTITANTLSDVANITVTPNVVEYFDVNSETINNNSSTITSETTLSALEAFADHQDINTDSQNSPMKENLTGNGIDTPLQLIDPTVNAEAKDSPDPRNKVNIISETIIKSPVHNEILSQFVSKVLTADTCISPVPLDHNIQFIQDLNQTSNPLNEFDSSRKEDETICNLDKVKQSFVTEKHLNGKCNQSPDEIVLDGQLSICDNEIEFVKGNEPTKKVDSKGELSVKYETDELLYISPRKYMSVKDDVHVKSSSGESGIFLDNRPSYYLGNLKSCSKSNKICVVSPLNIFSKKDNIKNSCNATDSFGKTSPKFVNKVKIHPQVLKTPELKTAPEKILNSPKLSESVIKMLLDSPTSCEILTGAIDTTVIPAYVHTSSTIADASDVFEPLTNFNCEDTDKIVASKDSTNCMIKKVSAMKCEMSSRMKSVHSKKKKCSKVLNGDTSDMNPENDFIPVDGKCLTSRLMPESITDINNKCLDRDANCEEMKADKPNPSTTDAQVGLIAKYIKAAVQACERKVKYQKNIKDSVKNRILINKEKTLFKNCKFYPSRKILNTHGVEKPGGNLPVEVKLNNTGTELNCSQLKTPEVEVHLFEDTFNEKTIEHGSLEYLEETGISSDNELNSTNTSTGSQDMKELIDMSNFGSVSYNTVDNFITKENVDLADESMKVYVVVEESTNKTREFLGTTDSDISELQNKSSFMEGNRLAINSRVSCEVVEDKQLDSQDAAIKIIENISDKNRHVNVENSLPDLGTATQHVSAEVLELCNDGSDDSKRTPMTIVHISNPKGAIIELNRTDNSYNLHISEHGLTSNILIEEVFDESFTSKKENKDVDEVINIPIPDFSANLNFTEYCQQECHKSDNQLTPHNFSTETKMDGPFMDPKTMEPCSAIKTQILYCQDINVNVVCDAVAKNEVIVKMVKDFDKTRNNKLQVSSYAETVSVQSSIFDKEIANKDYKNSLLKDLDDTIHPQTVDSETILAFENDFKSNESIVISECNSDNDLDDPIDDHGELPYDAYLGTHIANSGSVINNNNDVDIPFMEKKLSHSMISKESTELAKTVRLQCTISTNGSDMEIINHKDQEKICKLDITNKRIDRVSMDANIHLMNNPCAERKLSLGPSGYDVNDNNDFEKSQTLHSTENDNKEIKSYNTTLYNSNNKTEFASLSMLSSQEKSTHEQTNDKLKPFKKRDRNGQLSIPIPIENSNVEESEISKISLYIDTEDHSPTMADKVVGSPIKPYSKIQEVKNAVRADIIDKPDEAINPLTMQFKTLGSGVNCIPEAINELTSHANNIINSRAQTPELHENPSINAVKKKGGRPKKGAVQLVASTVVSSTPNLDETRYTTHSTLLDNPCAQIDSDEMKLTEKIENNLLDQEDKTGATSVLKKRCRPKKNVIKPSSSTQNESLYSTFESVVSTTRSKNLCKLDNDQNMQNKDKVSVEVREKIETTCAVSQNETSSRKRGRPRKMTSEFGELKKKRGRPRRCLQKRGRPRRCLPESSSMTENSSSTVNEVLNCTKEISTNRSILENPADERSFVQRDDIENEVSMKVDKTIADILKDVRENSEASGAKKKRSRKVKQLTEEPGLAKMKDPISKDESREVTQISRTVNEVLNCTEEISTNRSILENPANERHFVQRDDIENEVSMKVDKTIADILKDVRENSEASGARKKRSRKVKQLTEEPGLAKIKDPISKDESREVSQITTHKPRRRKIIVYSDDEFDGSTDHVKAQSCKRYKSIALEPDDEPLEQVGENSASQEVTVKCGLCEVEVASSHWLKHSAVEHNYLAHRSGKEAINIKDSKLVIRFLGLIHKQLLKDFKCNICGLLQSSASGFYTHIVSCQKEKATLPSKGRKKLVYAEPEVPTTSTVKCAVCYKEMRNNGWSKHLLVVHNNLAWFEGAKPIDLQNEKLVLAILIRVLKDTQSIRCHKCGATRASALGFIAHMAVCQKTEEEIENMKIRCEVCQKVFMPSAIRAHMNTHRTSSILAEAKTLAVPRGEEPQTAGSGGRPKRAAAKAAENSFAKLKIETTEDNIDWRVYCKEPFSGRAHTVSIHRWHSNVRQNKPNRCYHIGCKYKDATVEGIKKHFEEECPFINKDYQCRRCKFRCDTVEVIKMHALDKHVKKARATSDSDTQVPAAESEEDEDEDRFDNEHAKSVRDELEGKTVARTGKMRPVKPIVPELIPNWTKRLYEKHLSKDPMFEELICRPVVPLSTCDALQYLPSAQESCYISYMDFVVDLINREDTFTDWRKYKLFESTVVNGAVLMFCGGPIQRMAWAPIRDLTAQDAEDQLLAISIHSDFSEEGFPSLTPYSHSNMLQFWSFSSLSNKSICVQPARLVLGLCHDYGVVWDMAWCPSGGHMEGTNGRPARTGLLTVACSNGLAYVFAIHEPTDLNGSETQFYKTEPVLELRLDMSCSETLSYQATSITWSIEKGHNVIAVGYSHGYIALFDLTIESPLLRTVESGITIIGPYYNSPEMLSPITGLTIYPRKREESYVEEGIILGAGSTAGAGLWSRYGTSNQTCLAYKKVNVTATFCIPHWPNLVCSLDNSSAKIGGVELALRSLSWEQQRHDDAGSQHVLSSAAACLSVHTCWWSGLTMQSTGSGKLLVLPTLHPSYYASRPRTQILSEYDLVTLKEKQPPPSEASLDTYESATKDHGVVIREYSFDSNRPAKLAPHVNKAPRFSCESYNLTNVTSICINPSASACSSVARGLQCGVVHVAPVRKKGFKK